MSKSKRRSARKLAMFIAASAVPLGITVNHEQVSAMFKNRTSKIAELAEEEIICEDAREFLEFFELVKIRCPDAATVPNCEKMSELEAYYSAHPLPPQVSAYISDCRSLGIKLNSDMLIEYVRSNMDKGCTFPDLSVTDACKNGFGKFATFLIENNLFNDKNLDMSDLTKLLANHTLIALTKAAIARQIPIKASITDAYQKGKEPFAAFLIENNLFNDKSLEMNFLTEKLDDAKLIELTRMAVSKKIPIKASITDAYLHDKIKFANFLLDNNLVTGNDKVLHFGRIPGRLLDDAQLMALVNDKRVYFHVAGDLYNVCGCGKFEFAKYLIENGLCDVNESWNNGRGTTPLFDVLRSVPTIIANTNSSPLAFIKYLVENGARVDGTHCYDRELAFALEDTVSNYNDEPEMTGKISQIRDEIVRIIDYLVSKGMNVNALHKKFLSEELTTIRGALEDSVSVITKRSPFYMTILQCLIKHGAKRCEVMGCSIL